MSKNDVYQHVLKPMQAVFPAPPKLTDEQRELALEEYADALSGFPASDLEAGWKAARNANRKAFWPTIAALRDACTAAVRDRREASPARKNTEHQQRFEAWLALRTGPMAQRAALEGWASSLKFHVLETGELPAGRKLAEMAEFAVGREARVAARVQDCSPKLRGWAQNGFDHVAQAERETRAEIERAHDNQ